MVRNGNGKYELSLRTIVIIITLAGMVWGLGGGWVGQRMATGQLQKDIADLDLSVVEYSSETKKQLAIHTVRIHDIEIRVGVLEERMANNLEAMSKTLSRLERKIDALQ